MTAECSWPWGLRTVCFQRPPKHLSRDGRTDGRGWSQGHLLLTKQACFRYQAHQCRTLESTSTNSAAGTLPSPWPRAPPGLLRPVLSVLLPLPQHQGKVNFRWFQPVPTVPRTKKHPDLDLLGQCRQVLSIAVEDL